MSTQERERCQVGAKDSALQPTKGNFSIDASRGGVRAHKWESQIKGGWLISSANAQAVELIIRGSLPSPAHRQVSMISGVKMHRQSRAERYQVSCGYPVSEVGPMVLCWQSLWLYLSEGPTVPAGSPHRNERPQDRKSRLRLWSHVLELEVAHCTSVLISFERYKSGQSCALCHVSYYLLYNQYFFFHVV